MTDKYEYHKQNDYPGERIAERKRVDSRKRAADKKSDARVAEKGRTEGLKADARVDMRGRMDDELMDSEKQRSTARAAKVNRRRDTADMVGLVVIAGLIVLLIVGSVWSFMVIQKQSREIGNLNSQIDKVYSDNRQLSIANMQLCGKTDTNPPTILYLTPWTSVSPSNNEMNVAIRPTPITVMFSEDMDPSTINEKTFTVEQRNTPDPGSNQYTALPIEGTVTYTDRKAIFTADERFYPNNIYGNVFTATITQGVKDIAGNSLVNDYIWSFTTGSNPFNTGLTTQQTG